MSTEDPAIALIGAGNVGRALARRLVAAGFTRVSLRGLGKVTAALAPAVAAVAEVLFLPVPGAAAVAAATGLERPGPGD